MYRHAYMNVELIGIKIVSEKGNAICWFGKDLGLVRLETMGWFVSRPLHSHEWVIAGCIGNSCIFNRGLGHMNQSITNEIMKEPQMES